MKKEFCQSCGAEIKDEEGSFEIVRVFVCEGCNERHRAINKEL